MNAREEQVYFISYAEGPIKIGRAIDIRRRINAIQTSLPYKVQVLGVVMGPVGHEKWLHDRFRTYKLRGEWYSRNAELLDFIKAFTQQWAPPRSKSRARGVGIAELMKNRECRKIGSEYKWVKRN